MAEEPKHSIYELEKLAQMRDELRVQAHLFKADLKDEWHALEEKWNELNRKVKPMRDATDKTVDDLGTAAELMVDGLRDGYKRMRDALKGMR